MSFHSLHIETLVDYAQGRLAPGDAMRVAEMIAQSSQATEQFHLVLRVIERMEGNGGSRE